MLRYPLLLLTLLFTCSKALAQARFAVMSDMHVLAKTLFDADDAFDSSTRLVEYSQYLFDQAVTQLLTDRPAYVFIPGDLTNDGELASHLYVAQRLKELTDAGIQVFVIPGNHDIGNPKAYDYVCNQPTASITAEQFRTLYAPFGYNQAGQEVNGLSYAVRLNDQLTLLCLDSRKPDTTTQHYSEGGLTSSLLDWAEKQALAASAEGRQVIVMMHHPFVEHFDGHQELAPTYLANQTAYGYPSLASAQNTLASAGVRYTLTGHYHLQSISRVETPSGAYITEIQTGSLSSYPCAYRQGCFKADGSVAITSAVVLFHPDADLVALGKKRNENTTRGMFLTLAKKMELKFKSKESTLNNLGIKTDAASIAAKMETYMLAPYNELINALSAGDEHLNDPQLKIDNCVKAYDTCLSKFFGVYYGLVKVLMKQQLDDYRQRMQMMVSSVFGNYVCHPQNVIPDNVNDGLCPIDFDRNYSIDDADRTMLRQAILSPASDQLPTYDLNQDHEVNVGDAVRFRLLQSR